jgi:hypothetical protein
MRVVATDGPATVGLDTRAGGMQGMGLRIGEDMAAMQVANSTVEAIRVVASVVVVIASQEQRCEEGLPVWVALLACVGLISEGQMLIS